MKQIIVNSRNDISKLSLAETGIPKGIERVVSGIIDNIKIKKDKALIDYTKKFDKINLTSCTLKIPLSRIESAWKETPPKIKKALREAKSNIQKYHSAQLPLQWEIKPKPGITMGFMYRPVERIGIYIPGGTAPLVSTVLMTAIPAKAAGVSEIVLVSPPKINKYILAAAYLAGINEIYQAGGAQVIAALAYGTQTIKKVDKIVGPGNIYVTCAKKLVFGAVDIDMLAGPSEILIIADKSAKTKFIAADLLSQLEHDPLSRAALITDSGMIYENIVNEINDQSRKLLRKDIISKSSVKGLSIIKVPNMNLAMEIANKMAPEHLEIMTKYPDKITEKIKNAGVILKGSYTPVALSDFLAGTNHVLPTGGTARSFSGLTVLDFIKPIGTIEYSRDALIKAKKYIQTFAQIEKLDAHGKSIDIRL